MFVVDPIEKHWKLLVINVKASGFATYISFNILCANDNFGVS